MAAKTTPPLRRTAAAINSRTRIFCVRCSKPRNKTVLKSQKAAGLTGLREDGSDASHRLTGRDLTANCAHNARNLFGTLLLVVLVVWAVDTFSSAAPTGAATEKPPNEAKYLDDLDSITNNIPIKKEKLAELLDIELKEPDSSSNTYYTIYKTSSADYKKIEARFSNSEPKGIIILEPYNAIKTDEIRNRYGGNFSVRVNTPANPNKITYSYKEQTYTLSFISNKENSEEISVFIVNWID